MSTDIVIYGAGGFAREVAWLVEDCSAESAPFKVVCFVDDNDKMHGKELNGHPVFSLEDARRIFPGARIVSGIGNPKTRERLMGKAASAGFDFATLIHPRTEKSKTIEVGSGAVICAGNILTVNISLGMHVQINLDCTVGHNVVMGDYTTLAPGVHVSGWIHFGRLVYVGTGAVFINGTEDRPLTIGDSAVVGAGACVTKSVASGATVVGVPARQIK